MPDHIIQSLHPPVPFDSASTFTFVFSDKASLDDSPAYIDAVSDDRISRFETYDLCLRLAHSVQQRGGARGDVAMIFSPNCLAWPLTFFGLIAAGLRPTLANSFYTPPELAHQIKDSGAKKVFVHPTLFPVLIETFRLLGISEREAHTRVVIMSYVDRDRTDEKAAKIGREWTRLIEFFGKRRLPSEELFDGDQANETALLCYSSGTTGLSKGVETTHQNVVSLIAAFSRVDVPDAKTDTSVDPIIPSLIVVLLWDFVAKVPEIILPRFEPETFAQGIEKYKISRFCVVPPILVSMSFHPAFDKYNMSTLKLLASGAAPSGRASLQRSSLGLARWGTTNLLSRKETTPVTHWLHYEDSIRKRGSSGRLIPNLQARLVDEDEKDVPPGPEIRGELWVRGPSVMKGYLNNPTATKNSITPDGWFKTGDIAVMDDEGYFSIVDRKKELIKYKGFQVPPADLEAVLLSREDILDAAVIGVESEEEATELPRAYIVTSRNDELLKDSNAAAAFAKTIQEWIRTKVASHKFLRGGVVIIDAIPKTGSGKILPTDITTAGGEGEGDTGPERQVTVVISLSFLWLDENTISLDWMPSQHCEKIRDVSIKEVRPTGPGLQAVPSA
ncbi:hypothetical protein BS47DRAFT_1401493 [Hydnum rufescens UP504]|uniref:Uncharacterized protein n=1 Tax=Hydnum rufescens UP504 TaxID=1448309 RepID=A0A9P6DIB9_9AGAM|nr:hypothetical protein BS47DRAFT_1401493 [Hydnum rufescens UP504]